MIDPDDVLAALALTLGGVITVYGALPSYAEDVRRDGRTLTLIGLVLMILGTWRLVA